MSIRKFRAARVTTTTGNTYVGQHGDVFYDESTGLMRVSDGVTPGGHFIPVNPATSTTIGGIIAGPGANVSTSGLLTINTSGLSFSFGDFYATGGNISTVNANEDFNILTNGTGNVNIIGNLRLYATGSGQFSYGNTPLLSVANSGNLLINGNVITNGNTTVNGSYTFNGNTIRNGTIVSTGATSYTGPASFVGNVTTTGNLIVNGPSYLNGPEVIIGNLTINGNLLNNGNTINTGYTTNNGALIQNGNILLNGNVTGIGNITTTGTLSVNGPFLIQGMNLAAWSVSPAQTMTGTTQAGAYQINTTIVEPTTVPANSGAKLPLNPVPGSIVFIANDSGTPMNVYPASGGYIDFLSTNAPFTLSSEGMWTGVSLAGNQWTTLNPDPQTGDNNVIVTQGNGIVQFSLAPIVTVSGNVNVGGNLDVSGTSLLDGNVTVLANVTATNFYGNGAGLTGLSTYGNTQVAAYLPTYGGNISSGNVSVTNNETVGGNVTVTGNVIAANVNATLHGNVVGSSSNLTVNSTSTAGTFISGQVNIPSQTIAKNTTVQDVTVTVTGLTTNHKVMVTPAADQTSGTWVTAAYPTAANTLGIQIQNTNAGGVTTTAFNLTYWAWI